MNDIPEFGTLLSSGDSYVMPIQKYFIKELQWTKESKGLWVPTGMGVNGFEIHRAAKKKFTLISYLGVSRYIGTFKSRQSAEQRAQEYLESYLSSFLEQVDAGYNNHENENHLFNECYDKIDSEKIGVLVALASDKVEEPEAQAGRPPGGITAIELLDSLDRFSAALRAVSVNATANDEIVGNP